MSGSCIAGAGCSLFLQKPERIRAQQLKWLVVVPLCWAFVDYVQELEKRRKYLIAVLER